MTKNKFGGNKARKGKNSDSDSKKERFVPEPNKAEGTCVAKITGICGDCRFKGFVVTEQGVQNREILFHLPKSSRKYGRINSGCYILASIRDFDQTRGDILFTYRDNQLSYLKNRRHIPDSVEVDEFNEETGYVFSGETSVVAVGNDKLKRTDDPYQPIYYLSDEEHDEENDNQLNNFEMNINEEDFAFEEQEQVFEKTNEAIDLFEPQPKKINLSN